MQGELKIRRVYEPEEASDGFRILADRLWPRGESKARADLDEWAKEAAPSNEQRKAFHDGKEDFAAFRREYRKELEQSEAAETLKQEILEKLKTQNVTLLYASKDSEHNNAAVLRDWILEETQPAGQTE